MINTSNLLVLIILFISFSGWSSATEVCIQIDPVNQNEPQADEAITQFIQQVGLMAVHAVAPVVQAVAPVVQAVAPVVQAAGNAMHQQPENAVNIYKRRRVTQLVAAASAAAAVVVTIGGAGVLRVLGVGEVEERLLEVAGGEEEEVGVVGVSVGVGAGVITILVIIIQKLPSCCFTLN